MRSSTLLAPACSEIEFSDYAPGPFVPDWPSHGKRTLPPETKLTLSATKAEYMKGEYVPLRVVVDGVDAALPRTEQGCPVLLASLIDPAGLIHIDEMTPMLSVEGWPDGNVIDCRSLKAHGAEPNEFEFDARRLLDEKTSNTVRFFTLAGTSSQGEIYFAASNPIKIDFEDPVEMPRTWGSVQMGVHVALSLDKLPYEIGEDIPLHIAAQVVSSERPVYAEPDVASSGFFSDMSAAFHLTLIGEDGIRVGNEDPSNLQLRNWGGFSGPLVSVCPAALTTGKVYPLERSAKRLGVLPKEPGTYRVFVTWSPFPASDPPCGELSGAVKSRPLVTVSSTPLTIRIVGNPVAVPGFPDMPIYEGWREHFRVVDTPLGEATATEDMQSHLQWLRLTLTKEQSIDSLKMEMVPGGRLAGWRFATRADVLTFFANFTGSADGHSTNPAIERALQHLLGGPLETQVNRDTGWSRRSTFAFLAEVRPARPDEGPPYPAVAPGDPPPCEGCGIGFISRYAYIAEDTMTGATIDPSQTSWSVSNSRVAGISSAILIVRDAP